MSVILAGVVALAVAANQIGRLGVAEWLVSLALIMLAIAMYVGNAALISHYIRKNAPEFANDEMWELTAGLGIVPRWVSCIGLLSISALIAALVPWLISLLQMAL